MFNDVAVAVRVLQAEELVRRVVVIDLDVHQGNGTAAIFASDPTVFTFSIHGERNFPFAKYDGDLDIALPDGTRDELYLSALRKAVDHRLPLAAADLVFYLAGAAPYEHDRFGKLRLTEAGLAERDQLVFEACRRHAVPVTAIMAGGYACDIHDVVTINMMTISKLLDVNGLPN